MTHFDNLLRAAFEAGSDHCLSEGRAPDFPEWRASLSGLDLSETPEPEFKVGDIVYVRADAPRTFADLAGKSVTLLEAWPHGDSWIVRRPNHHGRWQVPTLLLERP